MIGCQLQRRVRVELLHQQHGGAGGHRRQQRTEPEDSEHRHRDEDRVASGQLQHRGRGRVRLHQIRVGEHDALGLAGRSRRVEDRIYVLPRIDFDDRDSLALATRHQVLELEDPVIVPEVLLAHGHQILQVGQAELHPLEQLEVVRPLVLLDHDDHRGLRVTQHELELMRGVGGIERDDGRAQAGRSQRRYHELGSVGKIDGDPVTGAHAQVMYRRGQRLRLVPHAHVRQFLPAALDERRVWRLGDTAAEKPQDRQA